MYRTGRDHGGGLDAAVARFGGRRPDWLDLSTGINPAPYSVPEIPLYCWTALPDSAAQKSLLNAARRFWNVPDHADLLAAAGVSALIAQLPRLAQAGTVGISNPTYNEHEAAFRTQGWQIDQTGSANVYVHPNNPDGRLFDRLHIQEQHQNLTIIDESFCDVCQDESLIELAEAPGFVVLKGLGKFWGLAGLRLGFAVARPETIAKLAAMLGPWPISGPAQYVGAKALSDHNWAIKTRQRLINDAARLDKILKAAVSGLAGGTTLFRLYEVENAPKAQEVLARQQIWSRIFPYSNRLLRLGLPGGENDWQRIESAVEEFRCL